MALKGTDVVKKLPELGKKNCKECGFPTCFAFAMKLASGGASLDKCPHLSAEAKAELEDALAPAIKLVTIGTGENALQIGNEEVVYRHEKTFLHPTGVALLISDSEPEVAVAAKIRKISELKFERVGVLLKANLLALRHDSGDRSKFVALVREVCARSDAPVMLMSEDTDALFAAWEVCAERRPLVYPLTKDNVDRFVPKLRERPTPVGVRAGGIEGLVPLTAKLREEKLDDVVLDPGSGSLMDGIRDQTFIRRAAIKQNFRYLGYPTIAFPCLMTKDLLEEALLAAAFIVKYAAIVVLSDFDRHTLLPLLTQRLNIYTDPRMPLSVKEGVYEIGEPDPDSPVLVTSNWALTYFIVSSEVEGSKVPSFLCVKDTEGLGVLTGWAAGKFTGDAVAAFIKKSGIEQKAKTRTLLIPGMVGRIRGDLEEALPEWKIVVGPREASEIPAFLPVFAAKLKQ
ncbi:MAG: acetyl-CoA decarbonylase/synthase complex subunit gamma [Dehalococcoidia bacterium]|nr:acetyl-CoA decarbonylase/synthase complex subunit gamma [Dehalococcoidia bacterium]